MKTFTSLLFTILLANVTLAQDTTLLQTLTFDSTSRAYTFTFPDGAQDYRQILMRYRMRCKNALVSSGSNTNLGCGEWDYSCNTYITDSSRVDSFHTVSPTHVISGFSDDVYNYTSQPTYSYFQSTQSEIIYNNTITEAEFAVGIGTNDLNIPFGGDQKIARTQFLYPATELTGQGLQTGFISGMKLDALNMAAGFENLRIRMKHTSQVELDAATMDNDGFDEVYYLNADLDAGNHFFKFHNNFDWDGSSNILIDISYTRDNNTSTNVKSEMSVSLSQVTCSPPTLVAVIVPSPLSTTVIKVSWSEHKSAMKVVSLPLSSICTIISWFCSQST